MFSAYLVGRGCGGLTPSTRKEIIMQQPDASESLQQKVRLLLPEQCKRVRAPGTTPTFEIDASAVVTFPELLRSRTRARRRRRKRAWGIPRAVLPPVFLVYGTFWMGPSRFAVYPSFFDWDMASPQKIFVSLENYRRALAHLLFYITLCNTPIYVVGTVGWGSQLTLCCWGSQP
jgi:hypothetical protein